MDAQHVIWCGVKSQTHLIYGASFIRQLLDVNRVNRGHNDITVELIPAAGFLNAKPVTLDQARAVLPEQVRLIGPRPAGAAEPAGQTAMLSVGAVAIKQWLKTFGRAPHHSTCVVTDEGIGSYGNLRSRRAAMRREGVTEPRLTVRSTANVAASRLLTSKRWALYQQNAAGWSLNQPVAAEFTRHATRTSPNQTAVLLSQPWPEVGVMTEAAHLAHVAEIAEACDRAGLDFLVHPHPSESAGRYDQWQVITSEGVAELNPQVVNAAVVLGATSTAMLNLAAVHGVPAVRVGTPELDALDRALAPRQASLLRYYVGESQPASQLTRRLTELMIK